MKPRGLNPYSYRVETFHELAWLFLIQSEKRFLPYHFEKLHGSQGLSIGFDTTAIVYVIRDQVKRCHCPWKLQNTAGMSMIFVSN